MLANSVDPDQIPHYMVSDLGLHCLLMTLFRFPGKNGLRDAATAPPPPPPPPHMKSYFCKTDLPVKRQAKSPNPQPSAFIVYPIPVKQIRKDTNI